MVFPGFYQLPINFLDDHFFPIGILCNYEPILAIKKTGDPTAQARSRIFF